jgi:hypothetical protein
VKKNEILSDYFESEEFDLLIKNLMGTDSFYFEDFKQDLFLLLLEKDSDKIEEMYENSQLDFYIVRVILNQVRSGSSPFYKTYKRTNGLMSKEELDENIERMETEYKEFDILRYCAENDVLSWYETEMLSAYYKLGRFKHSNDKVSYRYLENEYGIDHVSICLTVNGAVGKILAHLKTKSKK